MPMSPRLLRPRQTIHPEAADWANRVRTNGGSVSGTTLNAVDRFVKAIHAAGIRDRFYRLNLFCGNSDASLNAVRTPLYRGPSLGGTQYGGTLDTHVNFVAGDYAETGASGGLASNSFSKRLQTGFKLNQLPDAVVSNHLGVYAFAHTPTLTNNWMIGSRESTGTVGFMRTTSGLSWVANNGTQITHTYGAQHPSALYLSSRRTATDHQVYENSTSRGTNTAAASTSPFDGDNWVFDVNNQGTGAGGFRFRLGGYTIGLGMTTSQVASLSSAWAAFNTALSRT